MRPRRARFATAARSEATIAAAFAEKYRNFGKCVSAKSKKALKAADRADREDIAEAKNAAKECASERETLGEDGFADKYGTNHNKRNAFGKCVSGKTHDEGSDDSPRAPSRGARATGWGRPPGRSSACSGRSSEVRA